LETTVNEAHVKNGAIHNNITVSDMFITLAAAEFELGALFLNAKTGF
jgi:hypothetical protein